MTSREEAYAQALARAGNATTELAVAAMALGRTEERERCVEIVQGLLARAAPYGARGDAADGYRVGLEAAISALRDGYAIPTDRAAPNITINVTGPIDVAALESAVRRAMRAASDPDGHPDSVRGI
jgi:hypothetical protein